jgi:hypothetical protein
MEQDLIRKFDAKVILATMCASFTNHIGLLCNKCVHVYSFLITIHYLIKDKRTYDDAGLKFG